MKTLITLIIVMMTQQVFAFDKEDSASDFRQAMLQSNKDYNASKKAVLDDENERIANWNDQDQETIVITADIRVEAKFVEQKEDVLPLQEITMNN